MKRLDLILNGNGGVGKSFFDKKHRPEMRVRELIPAISRIERAAGADSNTRL